MSASLFLIFNHDITPLQESDAYNSLGVQQIINMPPDLKELWGFFWSCFIRVNVAFETGLIPVYSTTEREAVEEQQSDGAVKLVHKFKHQSFRKYGV
jgi:hypothetical protein